MVRQFFELGLIESGYWHQFALTAHSPVGLNPEKFKITPHKKPITFADNDVQFTDHSGIEHDKFSFGLKKALLNYMHGIGFDIPLNKWFNFSVPRTKVNNDFISTALTLDDMMIPKEQSLIYWLGSSPTITHHTKKKKGKEIEMSQLKFQTLLDTFEVNLTRAKALWLMQVLPQLKIEANQNLSYKELKMAYEKEFELFEEFWFSKPILRLKENGLILINN